MDIFEYLPQLIVAYDGDDEFANLIHVKKADKGNNYLCPCCGGTVKPRALDSNKEQSHYYHVTGKCTKESQLHFFCKNWLFEKGSKFYINERLFEVESVQIETQYDTPFGKYMPDVTVHTTIGKEIYFEMFFANRKTGDDYYCKWDYLGNDVVEVNIKDYMFKTNEDDIPTFKYLFQNGICYSKIYVKRDLYANTIAKIKRELTRQKILNYKVRIEQLDWFWQEIRNNDSKDDILNTISEMNYDDMVLCYSIIKRKQCMSYLKNDVLKLINGKVISEVREELGLPYDENVYFDLNHIRGRTYEAGIRLNIKTEHITYNSLFAIGKNCLKGFPKLVFSKNILNKNEIVISDDNISQLNNVYKNVIQKKEELLKYENEISYFEKDIYKIRMNNNAYTVLLISSDNIEILFKNRYIHSFNINKLSEMISQEISENRNKEFLEKLFSSDDYSNFIQELKEYNKFNITVNIEKVRKNIIFKMYIGNKCFYNEVLDTNLNDFNKKKDECILLVQEIIGEYNNLLYLVDRINNCKNGFWKAIFSFDRMNRPVVTIDQKYFVPKRHITFEHVHFDDLFLMSEKDIINNLECAMHKVMKNMERCGYRVMEVRDEK